MGRPDAESETLIPVNRCDFDVARAVKAAPKGHRDDPSTDNFIVHSLRGEGFDASEDGTGRGTPLVPIAYNITPSQSVSQGLGVFCRASGQANAETHYEQSPTLNCNGDLAPIVANATAWSIMPQNSGKDYKARAVDVAQPVMAGGPVGGNQGGDYIQQTSAVRRLTPQECERLQGFPEIENTLRILVCKSEDEKRARAQSAQRSSQVQWPDKSGPVAVNVLIDLERQVLQLHSLGRSPWTASIAEFANSCRPPMRPDAFAHLAALTHSNVGQATRNGVAASQPNIRLSTQALNGSASVLLCGQEIAALASDAERFTAVLSQCLKSTTSQAGRDSESFASTLETLACCVSTAISGFIPDAIRDACSYELRLTTHCGYTAITHRKKAAADGPRYKALGNSMAVPVMRWIGERIAMVEAAQEAAA